MKVVNILKLKKSRLLQTNKQIGNPLQKYGSKDGPVLSFATNY